MRAMRQDSIPSSWNHFAGSRGIKLPSVENGGPEPSSRFQLGLREPPEP